MSSVNRDIVCRWQEAVVAVESGRLGDARSLLWEIRHFSAKIWYNLAVVHLMENDYSAADKKFEECLLRDRYLAVAHFQRGVIACLQGRLSAAQEMFARAQEHVRNSDLIDYRQLGLALRLTQKQIEHNQGAVEKCLRKQQPVMKTSLEELEILPLALFRPAKSLVDNLQKQQFLQKAKLVSSVPHIVRDSGDIVAGGPQSLSPPTSPSSQRRLCVLAVNQQGSHTPPPRRPPPRLPQSSSFTAVSHHGNMDRKPAAKAREKCDQHDDSVSHKMVFRHPTSSCPASKVRSSATPPSLSDGRQYKGDNLRSGLGHSNVASQHDVSNAGEISGGTITSHTVSQSPDLGTGPIGHGVEVTPTVGNVATRIRMINSSEDMETQRKQEGRSLGTKTAQQSLLQIDERSRPQVVKMEAQRGTEKAKPARPPPPKMSWSNGS